MAQKQDWDRIRANKWSPVDTPPNWPTEVRPISQPGLSLFGINPSTNELYWDGSKLITEKRFTTFERGLAIVGLVIAFVGVAATVAQAVIAYCALPTN